MSNEIAKTTLPPLEFDGVRIEWQPAEGMDHGVATTIGHLARALGYVSTDKALQVIDRNRTRFKASEATPLKLRGVDGRLRDTEAVSPRGALKFCFYARTVKAFQFHDAVIELLDSIGSGDVVPVKRDRLAMLEAKAANADNAIPVMRQLLAVNAHQARAQSMTIEFCAATLSAERCAPAAQILRSLKREDTSAGDLFSALRKQYEGHETKPVVGPGATYEERVTAAIKAGSLTGYAALRESVAKTFPPESKPAARVLNREVMRAWKTLYNLGRVGFTEGGAMRINEVTAVVSVGGVA